MIPTLSTVCVTCDVRGRIPYPSMILIWTIKKPFSGPLKRRAVLVHCRAARGTGGQVDVEKGLLRSGVWGLCLRLLN